MFLRNYYNLLAINAFKNFNNTSGITSYTDVSKSTFEVGSLSLKSKSGTVNKTALAGYLYCLSLIPYSYIGTYSISYFTYNTGYNTIVFGSGDTPVTFEDYELDTEIPYSIIQQAYVSNTNCKINSVTYDSTTHKYTANVSVMVTNSSDQAITIKEFGLGYYCYLYYREVLTTPFTIPAGESAWFNYNVEVTVPEL